MTGRFWWQKQIWSHSWCTFDWGSLYRSCLQCVAFRIMAVATRDAVLISVQPALRLSTQSKLKLDEIKSPG